MFDAINNSDHVDPTIFKIFNDVAYIRTYVCDIADDLIEDFGNYKSKNTIYNELSNIIFNNECITDKELRNHLNNYISKYVDDSYEMEKQNKSIATTSNKL